MSLRFIKKRQRWKPLWFWVIVLPLFLGTFFFLSGRVGIFSSPEKEIEISEDLVHVKVWEKETGKLLEIGLEAYILGVVAAEMPASFPLEALKAQAVAARTYAVQHLQVPDPRVKALHPEANLSSDPAVNQAWISTAEMKKRWGKWHYAAHREKIRQAVEETKGQVLLYKGQLIDPVYHASCGGKRTENSGEVWKFDVPYLRGVPCTGHQDRHHSTALFFTLKTCDALLDTNLTALPASKFRQDQKVFQIKEKSVTGRVKVMTIGGKAFSGTELRTHLNLPSTRFTCEKGKNGLNFISNGYGHGVGMCQYGAADLAAAGKDYKEILRHYYTGVQMGQIKKTETG
ncbi:MAG: stage II sporulation protein D [Clostridia bacterium]|jgi:stage II sporulation protein D|nr:stage II sporulation protein D [Clostridia bacterium]MDD4146830.1 stage II sporulation protein D [Clostridia bacterium]